MFPDTFSHSLQLTTMSADYQFGRWLSSPLLGDEVVVTGISGRFPESNNVDQLQKNLFNRLNITTEDNRRWNVNLPGVPKRFGKIPDIEKFDGGFFGIHYRQAKVMSPMIRKSLEIATEAILDAGINPSELRGSKTGVFSATAPVFSDVLVLRDTTTKMFPITGCTTADISHRISYFLKVKGTSCGLEMDCSGSFIALDMATTSIRLGKCDNAIVVACNLLQHPEVSRELAEVGILSPEGMSRVFDEDANGYVRSEAVACIFLQRAKSARRIYGKIAHVKIGCDGYKLEGITVPSPTMQTQLMQSTLAESGVEPSDISYFEAHGTGTKIGDPHEADSIDAAIAKNRQIPLLVGAIKNNIGHSEASSGLCSLIKAIIAMETGLIPPTINVKQLKKGIKGFEENRMRVVTEVEKLAEDAYISINCFGWGGGITHLIVKSLERKRSNDELARSDLPRLVLVSGRSRQSVFDLLDDVARQPDEDYLSLLQEIFKENVSGHLYRGFAILDKEEPTERSVKFYDQNRRNLIVYFGPFKNGFQLLGRQLLKVPLFKNTTERIFKSFLEQKTTIGETFVSVKTDASLTAFAVQLIVVQVLKMLQVKLTPVSNDLLHNLIIRYYNDEMTLKEIITEACKVIMIDQFKKNGHSRNSISVPKGSLVLNVSDKPLRGNKQDMILSHNFLHILGSLYQQGHNPQIHKLYSNVQLPVNRGTPMISHMVRWNHDRDWYTYKFSDDEESTLQRVYEISYQDYEYLTGYQIDGVGTVPASEVLHLVWQTFKPWFNSPVVFENCEFLEPVIIPKTGKIKLFVSILSGSRNFVVCKDQTLVACGKIFVPENVKQYQTEVPFITWCDKDPLKTLTHEEIYRELNLKGYNYRGLFKGVEKCNLDGSSGLLRWDNNWTTFLDSMLQVVLFQDNGKSLYLPVSIRRLTIDAPNHVKIVTGEKTCPFYVYKTCRLIRSGGVEIFGVETKHVKTQWHQTPILAKHVFVSNVATLNLEQSIRVNIQIIVERSLQIKIKAVEIFDDSSKMKTSPLLSTAHRVIEEMPLITSDFIVSSKSHLSEYPGVTMKNVCLTTSQNLLLVVVTKILQKPTILNHILRSLSHDGFVLTREDRDFHFKEVDNLELLTEHVTANEKLILLQKSKSINTTEYMPVSWRSLNWIPKLQDSLKNRTSVTIYNKTLEPEGVLGLTTSIRLESGGEKLRCLYMMDKVPGFDPQLPFYKRQLKRNFPVNVFKNNKWGTYRYFPVRESSGTSKFRCDEDKSYIIVGGLQAFGLELAEWLIVNGATKIVLVSKLGIQTGYQARKILLWRSSGVDIVVFIKDTTTTNSCLQLVEEANYLGQIDGIFNLYFIQRDALTESHTLSFTSIASVAICLDEITRQYCQHLRYFVMFSSMLYDESIFGMANSVMERVCEKRREVGLPGLAIQWGPIGDIGVSARSEKVATQGLTSQKLLSCLDALDKFLNLTDPVVSSMVVAEKKDAKIEKKTILDRVTFILGIKNIKSIDTGSTFAQLGIDSIGGAQIVQIFELEFGMSLTLKELRSLTVAKLVGMEEEIIKNTNEY